MKILYFDDFKLGILKGDTVVDVTGVVQDIPHTGPHDLINGLIERFDAYRDKLKAAVDAGAGVPVSSVRIRPPLPKPGNIDCMAVNYMEDGTRDAPAPINAFQKSASAIIGDGDTMVLPDAPATIFEGEAEIAVVIGKRASNVAAADALDYVFGYAVGFDVIRRDVMHDCIANEHSWDLCKSFTGASPVSAVRPAAEIGHPKTGEIILEVDGEIRQQGDISQLIWKTADIVSRLSHYDRICVGDIIFTGTPKGPKPVVPGNQLIGRIDSIAMLNITINQ